MRTALCISGQPRNVELGFPYIRDHVINLCHPDVFIHMEYSPSVTGRPFINAGGHKASDEIPADIAAIVQTLYRPMAFRVEEPASFNVYGYNERKLPGINPLFSLRQRYSLKQANTMKQLQEERMGMKYDAVIRMRFDWAIQTQIRPEDFRLDGVSCPNDCPHPGGINDQFAIGSSGVMDLYAGLFDLIPKWFNEGIVFCDELLLGHHLQQFGVPVYPERIRYGLIRHKQLTQWAIQ